MDVKEGRENVFFSNWPLFQVFLIRQLWRAKDQNNLRERTTGTFIIED